MLMKIISHCTNCYLICTYVNPILNVSLQIQLLLAIYSIPNTTDIMVLYFMFRPLF